MSSVNIMSKPFYPLYIIPLMLTFNTLIYQAKYLSNYFKKKTRIVPFICCTLLFSAIFQITWNIFCWAIQPPQNTVRHFKYTFFLSKTKIPKLTLTSFLLFTLPNFSIMKNPQKSCRIIKPAEKPWHYTLNNVYKPS